MNTIEQCFELEIAENKPPLTTTQKRLISKCIEFVIVWNDELSAYEISVMLQLVKMGLVYKWKGGGDPIHYDLTKYGYDLYHPQGKFFNSIGKPDRVYRE